MNIALVIIIVIAIVLAIVGGLSAAFNWLLWVALIVGVIALIVFLFRVIGGRPGKKHPSGTARSVGGCCYK